MTATYAWALKRPSHHQLTLATAAAGLATVIAVTAVSLAGPARAAGPPEPPLGTTSQFGVLAGSGITNTGATTVTGDLGTFPTPTITGSASITTTGTIRGGDSVVQGAKPDLVTAYNNAAGAQPPAALDADAGGKTLVAGVYRQASALQLTGVLTLDGQGDASSVFIIQVGSDFTSASASSVSLVNGAQACHVYWQIGGSATFGTGTAFKGNVLALTSITANNLATFDGRLLARNGAVTLDTNTITRSACTPTTTTPAPTATATTAPVTPAPTATKRPTPRPTKSTGGGKGGSSDGGSSDSDGGSSNSDSDSSDGGGAGDSDAAGGTDTDTDSGSGTSSSATGIPNAGGPPLFLAPVGALAVLAGAGLVMASRRRQHGSHRG